MARFIISTVAIFNGRHFGALQVFASCFPCDKMPFGNKTTSIESCTF